MEAFLDSRRQAMIATPSQNRHARWILRIVGLAAILGTGLWLRSLSPTASAGSTARWWSWPRTATVTLYFADGQFLFPVSRRMPAADDLPRAVLETLLAGPRAGTGLNNPIPEGAEIRSMRLADGVAYIDLSRAFAGGDGDSLAAETSVVRTMLSVPGVNSVALSVEGTAPAKTASRAPLLYYPSAKGMVALPASSASPRDTLTEYLSGPADPELTGFPRDARLLRYEFDPGDGLLSLDFAYSASVRSLALDRPGRMRLLLLSLIATLTEFAEVRAVRLDFQGQTRLGLGQCSDLLRAPQARPQLLNDERLL